MSGGAGFKDVEVIYSAEGKPEPDFHGRAREMVDRAGITESHISMFHTDRYAAAFVVLEK
ncbi:MAG: hypothetical protein PHY29_03180 [Syntrophales bacterium]|nr:hypothetical protein [Syntrophales bacterium]